MIGWNGHMTSVMRKQTTGWGYGFTYSSRKAVKKPLTPYQDWNHDNTRPY